MTIQLLHLCSTLPSKLIGLIPRFIRLNNATLRLIKKHNKPFILSFFLLLQVNHAIAEQIITFTVDESLGTQQNATINVDVQVDKRRDLHVVLKEDKTWRNIKDTIKPIKKSGKYHFTFETKNLSPGKYRIDAFLTPKRKDWNDRIGETLNRFVTVINAPFADTANENVQAKHKEKQLAQSAMLFGKEDRVKSINWPKEVKTNEEFKLTVKYTITSAKDLHIRLLNSNNWQEQGAVKIKLKKSGETVLPFGSMVENFEPGKYAWVVSITDTDNPEAVAHKMGKHFTIGQ